MILTSEKQSDRITITVSTSQRTENYFKKIIKKVLTGGWWCGSI